MSHIPYNEKIGTECFGGSDYPTEEELATAQANRRSVADQRAYEAVLRGEPDIRPRCKHGYPLRGCCGIPGTPTTALEPDPLIGAWLVLDSSSVPLFVCGQTTLGMFYVRFADAVHQADARHKSELVCLRPATLIEVVKAKYAGNDRITTGVWNDGELCWGVMVDGAPVIYSANAGLTREAAANAAVLQCTGSDVDKALAHIDRALAKPAPPDLDDVETEFLRGMEKAARAEVQRHLDAGRSVAVLTTTLPPDGSVAIGALAPSGGNIGATAAPRKHGYASGIPCPGCDEDAAYPGRPAVGTTHPFAVAAADGAAHPEANWVAVGGRIGMFTRLPDDQPIEALRVGYPSASDCEHGYRRGKCDLCELIAARETIARLAVEIDKREAARAEVDRFAEQGELRAQLATVTLERDEWKREAADYGLARDKYDEARAEIVRLTSERDANPGEPVTSCTSWAELRAQLATVTKERDALRTSLDLAAQAVNNLAHGTRGSKGAVRAWKDGGK